VPVPASIMMTSILTIRLHWAQMICCCLMIMVLLNLRLMLLRLMILLMRLLLTALQLLLKVVIPVLLQLREMQLLQRIRMKLNLLLKALMNPRLRKSGTRLLKNLQKVQVTIRMFLMSGLRRLTKISNLVRKKQKLKANQMMPA